MLLPTTRYEYWEDWTLNTTKERLARSDRQLHHEAIEPLQFRAQSFALMQTTYCRCFFKA